VKKGEVLAMVGFESRGQFLPVNKETEVQNEKDRQMLLKKLDDLGIVLKGDDRNAPLHQLGKTYNYHDPRLKHVRRKSSQIIEKTPVLGMDATPENPSSSADEGPTRSELRKQITAKGGAFAQNDNKAKLTEILAGLTDKEE
jgi:hypothetical protein